ncbi:uncharacterized protein PV06_10229 [Exophiala oligosperma]|uniref:Uncharacterized protein n=1 Tax=Exophiala oligosperma TaxID=215243 RepID=A0A0D2D2P9_9EURO|nr:uncharacterized protein PV06_10229 [Exophiala oligosperma]KIW37583.1 hypothetical protein PV06_10229 [Exophiala oligosperma]
MEEGIKKMEGGSDRPGFEFKKPLFPASAIRRAKPTRARQRGHLVTIRSNSPVASHRYLFSYPPKAATDCTDPNHLQAVAWLAGDGVKKHPDSNHRAPVNANIENKTVSVLSQYEANPETGVEALGLFGAGAGRRVALKRQCILPTCRSRRVRKATELRTSEKKPKQIKDHGGLLRALRRRLEKTSYPDPANTHVRVTPRANPGTEIYDVYARAFGSWDDAMCENISGYKDDTDKRSWYSTRDSEKCGSWKRCALCEESVKPDDVPLTFTLEKSYEEWIRRCASVAA